MIHAAAIRVRLSLFLFLALVASLPAQENGENGQEGVSLPLWTIEAHDSDFDTANQEIADLIARGLMPVGVEYRPGSPVVVLYSINPGNLIQEVALHTFNDLSEVNPGVSAFIERGFTPVGLSRHEEGLTFLFVKGAQGIGRWGIVSASLNTAEVEESFDSLASDGFSAWGITVWDGSMMILALEEPALEQARESTIQLYNFDPNSYTPAISTAVTGGLYPWGIAVNGSELYIQYTPQESDQDE